MQTGFTGAVTTAGAARGGSKSFINTAASARCPVIGLPACFKNGAAGGSANATTISVFIPEGCWRIAQRFNVGFGVGNARSPGGTVDSAVPVFGRPFGTLGLPVDLPNAEAPGYSQMSLWDQAFVATTQIHVLVLLGVSPAVEPGILPPGNAAEGLDRHAFSSISAGQDGQFDGGRDGCRLPRGFLKHALTWKPFQPVSELQHSRLTTPKRGVNEGRKGPRPPKP